MRIVAYIGGRWHFVRLRPTSDLKELRHLRYAFHTRHELGQRDDFLVDLDKPALDVRVVVR